MIINHFVYNWRYNEFKILIEFSDDSRELVKQYSSKKMDMKAYDDVSQRTSNIAAQQKIAEGIRDNGLGNGGGMVYGMNIAQNLGPTAETKSKMSLDEQIETLKKLKELVDIGILTQEEFDAKKKEGTYVRYPEREELNAEINESLIVEYYNR